MGLTLVTAFFRLPEERERDYAALFDELAGVGLPIVVFFDATLPAELVRLWRHPNVTVVPSRLEDSWTWRTLAPLPDLALPRERNPAKDSRPFLTMVNAKLDYLQAARSLAPTSHLAWIDFGILHVVAPPRRATFLDVLRGLEPPGRCLLAPGCQDRPTDLETLWERVSWRFCGGFLLGDRDSTARLYERYQETLVGETARRRSLTWEVNLWALLEAGGARFDWYRADHDETLLPG